MEILKRGAKAAGTLLGGGLDYQEIKVKIPNQILIKYLPQMIDDIKKLYPNYFESGELDIVE